MVSVQCLSCDKQRGLDGTASFTGMGTDPQRAKGLGNICTKHRQTWATLHLNFCQTMATRTGPLGEETESGASVLQSVHNDA